MVGLCELEAGINDPIHFRMTCHKVVKMYLPACVQVNEGSLALPRRWATSRGLWRKKRTKKDVYTLLRRVLKYDLEAQGAKFRPKHAAHINAKIS